MEWDSDQMEEHDPDGSLTGKGACVHWGRGVFVITTGGRGGQVEHTVGSWEHSYPRAAVFYIQLVKSHRWMGAGDWQQEEEYGGRCWDTRGRRVTEDDGKGSILETGRRIARVCVEAAVRWLTLREGGLQCFNVNLVMNYSVPITAS